jgi:L-ascorbate metabolism protein UlaG (beta-lactamase superfamily)
MKKLCLLLAILLSSGYSFAQKELSYSEKEEASVDNQTREVFAIVDCALLEHFPTTDNIIERRMAMSAIDLILHDKMNDRKPSLYDFMDRRIGRIADKLAEPVEKGMRIFKLYNDSFIVKTASVTVAFDLIQGGSAANPFISDDLMRRIVEQCDIMFISHEHGDHVSIPVSKMFTEGHKTIIAPTGVLDGTSARIRNVRSEQVVDHDIKLSGGRALKVRIFPGHQDYMINNIYHIDTPEGISVMHTGDQYGKDDLKWLADIHKTTRTDILLANCWITSPEISIGGIAPKLLIPGHENELGHTIDHREPNWLTWERMRNLACPKVYMTWGEWYDYIP